MKLIYYGENNMKNQFDIRIKSNIKLDRFKYDFKNSMISLKLKYPQYFSIETEYKNNRQIIIIKGE